MGDAKVALADINTEDETVVNIMKNWITDLVSNYSIDGLRLDTVKHVGKAFWPDFVKSAGVYTLGEVIIPYPLTTDGPY